MNILSENLKRFRLEKNYTQEDVANILNVNPQTISRWECGTTMPDVLLLPQISEIYGITIDDLYRKSSIAYKNYAQRLAAVYELTRSPEDFLRALLEFEKLEKSGEMTTLDKFNYAFIFYAMLFYCKDNALKWYDSAIADGPENDPHSYSRCRSLKAFLLGEFGQGKQLLEEQQAKTDEKSDVWEWNHLIELYQMEEQYEEAYKHFQKAISIHKADWRLYFRGAEICVELKKYDEALDLYAKAGEIGTDFHDEMEGIAWCYQKMGEYEKALAQWRKLQKLYISEGYEYEAEIYSDHIEELKDLLNKI